MLWSMQPYPFLRYNYPHVIICVIICLLDSAWLRVTQQWIVTSCARGCFWIGEGLFFPIYLQAKKKPHVLLRQDCYSLSRITARGRGLEPKECNPWRKRTLCEWVTAQWAKTFGLTDNISGTTMGCFLSTTVLLESQRSFPLKARTVVPAVTSITGLY